MATGVPKNGWRSGEVIGESVPSRNDSNIALSYEGKEDEKSIVSTCPAKTITIWPRKRAEDSAEVNSLYYGDNLPILASLLGEPNTKGKIRLVYIDPPFGTKSFFQSRSLNDAYADVLSGSRYIEFLRRRLILIREMMASDGSIYVHLDEHMAFCVKLVMDEVFGARNFRNWITRRKCNRKNYTRKTYGNVADYILFYTKTDKYVWNRPMESWTEESAKREYQYVAKETGRRYKKVPVHAPGVRRGATGKPWKGMLPPPGKHWQYTPEKLDEMDARGEIYWSPTGNPRRKIYFDNSKGVPIQDIWLDFLDAHNQNISITGYPTEKNPDLLRRIIQASSNPGDLVLDCFSGSGTTLAVAHELGRKWIGIDNSLEAISMSLKRFMSGTKPMGDFVSHRNAQKSNKENPDCLNLFGQTEMAYNRRRSAKYTPITGFRLLTTEANTSELDIIVKHRIEEFSAIDCEKSTQDRPHGNAEEILTVLGRGDSSLARLIQIYGRLETNARRVSFHQLCIEIINQQLSKSAAMSITSRLQTLTNGKQVTPALLESLSDVELRSAGISGRKISCFRDLVGRVQSGDLSLRRLAKLDNSSVIVELTKVKGIGRWTAEMYLIFVLNRPDVFPLDDAGLRLAMRDVYGLSADASDDEYISISDRWRPYRSYGSRYLWLHRDHLTQQPVGRDPVIVPILLGNNQEPEGD